MSRTIRTVPPKYLRNPHTKNERTHAVAAKVDGVGVRPKRNARHLPTEYDDKPVAAIHEIHKSKRKWLSL